MGHLQSLMVRSSMLELTPLLRATQNKRNREQRIRISIYEKSCTVEYIISNKLIFLFFLYSFYSVQPLTRISKTVLVKTVFMKLANQSFHSSELWLASFIKMVWSMRVNVVSNSNTHDWTSTLLSTQTQ